MRSVLSRCGEWLKATINRYPRIREFGKYFLVQFISYSVVDCSNRWVAQGAITLSVIAGAIYPLITVYIISKISDGEAKTKPALLGLCTGGLFGTWAGILASKAVTGV